MQNKFQKHLLITSALIFLLLQNLSAQPNRKVSEQENSTELILAAPNQTSSVQSAGGGNAQSSSYNNTAAAGQPGPVGFSTSASYTTTIGFIPTLIFGISDTTGDYTAPLAPQNLIASPSDWTSTNGFSLNWNNPEPDTNIAGAWHKIGVAPVNDNDGSFDSNDIVEITGITADNAGESTVYVWLQDQAGNHSHLNAATTVIRFDSIPPVIPSVQVVPQNVATDITITAAITDPHSGINTTYLYYRLAGDNSGVDSVGFINDAATIPASVNTQRGVEFAIKAADNATNISRSPATGFSSIQIMVNNPVQPLSNHSGTAVIDYRIFSVPFVLDDKRPSVVFEDDLGTYDDSNWRLYDVNSGSLREYPAIRSQSIVGPGKGFLLIMNMSGKYIDVGSGRSPKVSTSNQIQLTSGWNLIGNPFDFDLPLDNLTLNGSIPQAWYLTSSGWSNNPTHLFKWGGLAINSTSAATLYINANSGSGYIYSVLDRFYKDDWGIRITAKGEQSLDLDNYIGIYSDEKDNKNTIWYEPPRFKNAISLRIKPNEQELKKGMLSVDDRFSTLIQPKNEEGYFWDFEIVGDNAGESVQIGLEYFAEVPQDFEKYLIDFKLNTVYDLYEKKSAIEFKTNNHGESKFRILIGTADFVANNSAGVAVIPEDFELRQNFPNPFNPNTNMIFALPKEEKISLEVYNILGEKIKTLINNKIYRKGYHTVQWNGKNDFDRQAASGMYIFTLKSNKQRKIIKGILMK